MAEGASWVVSPLGLRSGKRRLGARRHLRGNLSQAFGMTSVLKRGVPVRQNLEQSVRGLDIQVHQRSSKALRLQRSLIQNGFLDRSVTHWCHT